MDTWREIISSIQESFRNVVSRLDKLEVLEQAESEIYVDEVRASGNLTLTTSYLDIPGATVDLDAGDYLITGIFSIDGGTDATGDQFCYCHARLLVDGVAQSGVAQCSLTWLKTSGAPTEVKPQFTVAQIWRVTLASTQTCKLQALKTGAVASGDSILQGTHTKIGVVGVLD